MMNSKTIFTLLAAGILTLNACKKKEEPTVPKSKGEAIEYAMMVTGGASPNTTAYFSGFDKLPSGTVGTADAVELTGSGIMYSYNQNQYLITFGAPATLRKYGFDDATGKPKELGAIVVQGLKTFGAVNFVSETEAYAASNGFGGVPKVVKFNPTKMEIISTIDVTLLQKAEAKNVFYLGMAFTDDYLFMGVNYQTPTFTNLGDSVYVAVINRKTDKVEKLISDGRTGMIWASGTAQGFSGSSLVIDENKDIYVHGTGNKSNVPSGVIRIKSGQTTFDPTYFFNLKTAVGSDCYGIFHYGGGKAFTLKSEDPVNYPFDDSKKAGYRYVKIDLYNRTSQGELSASLPMVSSSSIVKKWEASKLYLSAPTPTSNAVYSFDIATGAVTKAFDVSAGSVNGFIKFK